MEINVKPPGDFLVFPVAPGKCPICAVEHDEDQPHDATSFYYRFLFKNQYGRDVTWADAMAHCSEEVKQVWSEYLTKLGIDINSTNILGDIKSQEDVEKRLNS